MKPAGEDTRIEIPTDPPQAESPQKMEPAVKDNRNEIPTDTPKARSNVNNCWDKLVNWSHWLIKWSDRLINWFEDKNRAEWLKETRGMLSLVSTMIATMTFQVALNPPGGVFEAPDDSTIGQLRDCRKNTSLPCAGEAVFAAIYKDDYILFQSYNTISFMASLSVSLLLVSGILLNKVIIWILSVGMIITITFVALTFLQGILLIHPELGLLFKIIYMVSIYTWIGLVGMVALFLTIRFLIWVVKNKIIKKISDNICIVKKKIIEMTSVNIPNPV